MDIRVSGHQIDTGAALQEHVDDRLNSIVDKYFSRAISSHVTFGKGPGGSFTSDIVTHVMQGLILKGHAEAHDVHQAFDARPPRIEKQLRRYKRRIKDRHEQAAHAVREAEAAYTILGRPKPTMTRKSPSDSPPVIAETKRDDPRMQRGRCGHAARPAECQRPVVQEWR